MLKSPHSLCADLFLCCCGWPGLGLVLGLRQYTGVFVSGCAIACVAVVGLCFWSGVTSSSSLAAVRVTYFATAAAVVCGAIASFLLLLSRIG